MDELIRSGSYVALRLPSEVLKIVELQPNLTISLGKFGSFQTNHLIGRPFHITYEILDKPSKDGGSNLRPVPAAELHDLEIGDTTTPDEASDGVDFEVIGDDGKVLMRTNQFITENGASQTLTLEDIEALKKADTSAGKDVIAKIIESHTNLDKKSTFSLAKYTLRKSRKYMKRFTVLPIDVPTLVKSFMEGKDGSRIMELREEILGLIMSFSNVHWTRNYSKEESNDSQSVDHNRWLAVDETSGMLVAAMAEQMGILHLRSENSDPIPEGLPEGGENSEESGQSKQTDAAKARQARIHMQELAMSGTTNAITLVHQNAQPNLSLLTYFGYNTSNPDMNHPLYTNLKEISFLQLLHPEEDYACQEPTEATADQLNEMKSRQKAAYYRKRRRWQRTKAVVDETQAGGFAGLAVASIMTPASILHRLVPLLRGGAQVVVYSPTIEPLTELVDCYSRARRTAFNSAKSPTVPSEEYPTDPRLLISVSLHTSRCKPWQVLPGRTHPKMSGRGGSEGYVFVGTKVHPVDGKIEARGSYKRRKLDISTNGVQHDSSDELRINSRSDNKMEDG